MKRQSEWQSQDTAALIPSASWLQSQVPRDRDSKATSRRAASSWAVLQLRELSSSSHGEKSLPVAQKSPRADVPRSCHQKSICRPEQFCSEETPASEALKAEEGKPTLGFVV